MSSAPPPSEPRRRSRRQAKAKAAPPDSQAESAAEGSTDTAILEHVVAERGLTLDEPRVLELAECASLVQMERRRQNPQVRAWLTRSTLIWTAARLDTDVGQVLTSAHFDMDAFGRDIGAPPTPPATARIAPQHPIEPELLEALDVYLSVRGSTAPVTVSDLACAVLYAADAGARGLVGSRLRSAGGDIHSALDAMAALAKADLLAPMDPKAFSGSVRAARSDLGPGTLVTAWQLGRKLLEASKRERSTTPDVALRAADLSGDGMSRRATDAWLALVRRCYDIAAVARTRHQVIDIDLALLALAEVDTTVAIILREDGVLQALRRHAEVQPRRWRPDRTEWSSDMPANVDELGRKYIAVDVAKRIRRLSADKSDYAGSFMVHLDGPWGAGKTSLFTFLRQELKSGFVVVDVNAWREQQVGVQWWILYRALQDELAATSGRRGKLRLWLIGIGDRIRANWVPFTIGTLLLASVLVGVGVGLNLSNSSLLAQSLVQLATLASILFAGLAAVSRYLIPTSRRSAQGMWDNSENPTREVARYFLRALRRAPRPVVFMIDDLDRCRGLYVVEFLEVVQTLVRDAPRLLEENSRAEAKRRVVGPYVLIAADGGWIRSSFEEHFKSFEATFESGRPLGYLFLEKLFQLHVRLPDVTPAAREAYLARLLRVASGPAEGSESDRQLSAEVDEVAQRADDEGSVLEAAEQAKGIKNPLLRQEALGRLAARFSDPALEHSPDHPLAAYHELLEPNPRSMKLFVNAYGVARSTLTIQEQIVPTGPLALWTVLEVRWPRLADYFREHPELADAWKNNADAPGDDVPVDIVRLLRDTDVKRVLDEPRWDRFSAERVKQCIGVGEVPTEDD